MNNYLKTTLSSLAIISSLSSMTAAKASNLNLDDMPDELIKNASTLSVVPGVGNVATENDYRKNLLNLGKVSKRFYNIYLSEYVVGANTAGEQKPGRVLKAISDLLTGIPVNFNASKGMVGAFNFADEYNLMGLHFGSSMATLYGLQSKNPECYGGQEVKISASNNALITEENKAWPFNTISKVTYSEYVSDPLSARDMFPDEPDKWDDPQCQPLPCGMATYTLYGKDKNKDEISVSYSFYKPAI